MEALLPAIADFLQLYFAVQDATDAPVLFCLQACPTVIRPAFMRRPTSLKVT